ncbi:MAG TPA: potassium-transporting ATPase subunit KdpA [Herpetosiphonaceae bacterium]
MTANGLIQICIFFGVLIALVKPLGAYMANVYEDRSIANRVGGPLERGIYRLLGVQPDDEMSWQRYTLAMLLFSLGGVLLLYLLQRLQALLPVNPQQLGAITPDSSFNTATSFVTNTNWQGYAGEVTMSYLTQMLGLTVQNFVSAATGMAILIAFIRGLARRSSRTLGNFWVDLTRSTLYILLPLSLIVALVLISQGTVQNFRTYQPLALLQATTAADGRAVTQQVLPMGPAASQVAIKHIGTNGGGFFNANAAHPFESPTPLTDLVLILAETVIAAALTYTFGRMVGDPRQGWAILAAMLIVLGGATLVTYAAEAAGNPRIAALGVDQTAGAINPGGNMEGKEVRFGVARSALFATATTATSTGAVNAMHDSFTPLGGLVPMFMIGLSETILGGVGSGLYGMLTFVIVAVFIAGLMVGRTPEYLGKKIEVYEIKMASLIVLVMPLVVLGLTALAVVTSAGKGALYDPSVAYTAIFNPGIHGFSEALYAFLSMGNNNGSAFAGLGANNPFWNLTGGIAMLISRFWLAIPTLAIAGSLANKKLVPAGTGTLPTHTPLFVVLLIGVVIVVGALTFIPAFALGPIVEHLVLYG